MTGPKVTTICLHGFIVDPEGNSTYADPHEATAWCVYTRTDYDENGKHPPEGFIIEAESDFETYDAALAEGEARAKRHNVELREY